MEYRVKKKQSGAQRRNSAQVLRPCLVVPRFSWKKASSCVPQHHTQAPRRHVRKRKLDFLRHSGAIKKNRGAVTSASAKKLKFDLIRSELAEDYKYKLITHENHHLSTKEHKRKRKLHVRY